MTTPHDALLATLVAPLAGTDGRIDYVSLERAEAQGLVAASRLPLTLKILVEGALRHAEDPAALDLAASRRPSAARQLWNFSRPACCCRISPASP